MALERGDKADEEHRYAEQSANTTPRQPARWRGTLKVSRWLHISLQIVLYLFSIYGFVQLARDGIRQFGGTNVHFPASYSSPQAGGCYCGESIKEAITLGCKYDELSAAWLPEICRDDELTQEFAHAGPGPNGAWSYWADRNHTQPLTVNDISLYADRQPELFHTTWEWHAQHCIFSWRKEHRSRFNGVLYDPRSDTEMHIKHCGMMLMTKTYGTTSGAVLVS